MKKKLLILFLGITLNSLLAQRLILKNYSTHNGLNSNLIISIIQSPEGKLLIGTSSGLNSFDGQNFEDIPEFKSLPVLSLFVGSDTTVFASTIDSIGIFKNRIGRKVRFLSRKDGNPVHVAYTFFELPQNKILIGTQHGIVTYARNNFIKEKKYEFLKDAHVYSINNDLLGNLYFATSKGLFSLSATDISKKLISEKTFVIFRNEANQIFVRTKDGFYRKRKNKFVLINHILTAEDRFSNFVSDYSGNLILSKGKNLCTFTQKNKIIPLIDSLNTPLKSIINVLFKDSDGKIWIGTDQDGLYKITDLSFTYYERHAGIKSDVFGIIRTSTGMLLVATDGQGVLKYSPKKNKFVDADFDNIGKTVWIIFEESNGSLWFSTNQGVFIKRKNASCKRLEGIPKNVLAINFFEDNAENIWITTLGKYLYKYNGKNLSKIELDKHGKDFTLYKILPDTKYGYWLIASEGIYKFNGEKIINYPFREEIGQFHFYDATFTKKGYLLLATNHSGLILVNFNRKSKKEGIKIFNTKNGLPNNSVVSVQYDNSGNLWALTLGGISIIKNIDALFNNKEPVVITFGKNDPILGGEFNQFSFLVDKDNSVWLGGVNILVHHKQSAVNGASHLIKPYIKNIDVNYNEINPFSYGGKILSTYSLPDNIALPASFNNLSFSLSAIDFTNPSYIKYSFKLEPLNKNFSEYTSNSQIHFAGLPSGEYTLFVKAKDQYNAVSDNIVKYHFTIKSPFYLTPYFIFSVLIFIILFIVGIFHYKNRMLLKKNKELKNIIEEKKIVIKRNELLSSEYRELFSSAYSPIIIIRRDTLKIIDANDSASKLLGYTREEFLKEGLTSFVKNGVEDIEHELKKISTLGGSNEGIKVKTFTKEGKVLDVEINVKSHIYKNHNCYIVSIKDLSAEVEIRRKLEKARLLYDKNKELQENFLSQISHEIRTPLNSIASSAELLPYMLGEEADEDAQSLLKTILISSKRIIRTVELILRQAELTQGNFKPNFEELKMCEIVSELHAEFRPEASKKGLEFSYSCQTEYIVVSADYLSVKTIISNFIENAIKYTSEGSVKILVYTNGLSVIIEVADTGIGIDKEFIPHIFDSFTQEEYQVYKRKKDGNGLGLAVSKQYAEINNAEIKIESKKGIGSKFMLIFHS